MSRAGVRETGDPDDVRDGVGGVRCGGAGGGGGAGGPGGQVRAWGAEASGAGAGEDSEGEGSGLLVLVCGRGGRVWVGGEGFWRGWG